MSARPGVDTLDPLMTGRLAAPVAATVRLHVVGTSPGASLERPARMG
jgi:hypothetical protein